MATKRVAIIGAGISGLGAIKSCLDEGLHPVCFEIKNEVGGLWNYSEEIKYGQGSVMKSTVINNSKEMMSFSDFPMPASAPNYLRHFEYNDYLSRYADANHLRKYIQFETEVLSVTKAEDFELHGKWVVSIKAYNNTVAASEFDFVMVCSGLHGRPKIPQFPGLEIFQGKIVHSHEVRNANGFEDKRILVVGLGNTGGDMSVELSRVASQVYLSTRSGAWIFSRVTPGGHPVDFDLVSRKVSASFSYLPLNWAATRLENLSKALFKNDVIGIKPAGRVHQMEPTFNDSIPAAVVSGQIIIHDDIKEFTKDGAVFVDGSKVANIDVVVMATGYDIQYPFLGRELLNTHANKVDLYNYCFPPDMQRHTLAIIGCVKPNGPLPMIAELQSRYVTRVFKKLVFLPSPEQMLKNLKQRNAADKMRYRDTMKNAVRIDLLPYCDIIAEAIGCKPNLAKMLLTDPRLAWECFFGPLIPSQYRLSGPGKWAGARDCIMGVWDRVIPANKNEMNLKRPSRSASAMLDTCPSFLILLVFLMIPIAMYVYLLK